MEIMLRDMGENIGGKMATDLYQMTKHIITMEMGEEDRVLIINFDGVNYIDSSTLGALVATHRTAKEHGKNIIIKNPSKNVYRSLGITNLISFFALIDGKDDREERDKYAWKRAGETVAEKEYISRTPLYQVTNEEEKPKEDSKYPFDSVPPPKISFFRSILNRTRRRC